MVTLLKNKPTMGIDCSTNSVAFAFLEKNELIKYGEINFNGADVYHRASDARKKMEVLSKDFDLSYVAIEKTIHVRSIDTAIKMAYVAGTVISCLIDNSVKVIEIAPITWQSGIGNPNLTTKEKAKMKMDFPAKTKSWYQNKGREIRKDRTRKWVEEKFGITIESDNVTDAIGIAWFAHNKM